MTLDEVEEEKEHLEMMYEEWNNRRQACAMILSVEKLFNRDELSRARALRDQVAIRIEEIEEKLRQNDKQKRLLMLDQLEKELAC